MFHRRLVLLVVVALTTTVVLAAQTANLTVAQGRRLRAAAESILWRQRPTPTTRGSIYDRHGRILAQDHHSYNVAVIEHVVPGWIRRLGYPEKGDHAVTVFNGHVGPYVGLEITADGSVKSVPITKGPHAE